MAYEVDSDGGDVRLRVCIIGESEQQARLSYTGVTDEEKLEEIVVSRRISLSVSLIAHPKILGIGSVWHKHHRRSGPVLEEVAALASHVFFCHAFTMEGDLMMRMRRE
jgi:hypothetical protein